MNAGLIAIIISVAIPFGGAVGWFVRQCQYRREIKRQASNDAGNILKERKKLIEEMISKTSDNKKKEALNTKLDEINSALLGLYTKIGENILKEAGLPTEDVLISDGLNLQPKQVDNINIVIDELISLPLATHNLHFLGSAYYYAKRYEDAKCTFDRLISINPDSPDAFNNRGATYLKLKRYDEALTDFNRSLELRPDVSATLSNRGVTYMDLGRYDESIADLDRSLKLKPDDADSLNNRGGAYYFMQRYDEALADINRSLELSPDEADVLYNRGNTYIKMERYDEALADFNRYLELRPEDTAALYNLACLFSIWGKTKKALGYLEKAIGLDDEYINMAKTDNDFYNIKDDPRFKKLLGLD